MTAPVTPLTKELNNTMHTESGTRSIRYMDTAAAYDLWSEVYDTDGNFLQALDNIEIEKLLPRAVTTLGTSSPTTSISASKPSFKVIDLGCGTGRNTIKLLDFPKFTNIVAVDLSPKMLEIARQRCVQKLESTNSPSASRPTLMFLTYDMINTPTPPSALTSPKQADLIISTLVLEHIPVPTFFNIVSQLLAPGGILLLTNMHSKMGKISQAGFVDPRTGDKIRPVSYAHELGEVTREAERYGLEVVKGEDGVGVKEVKMGREMIEKLGVRSGKWVGVDVWFGGIWRKKVDTGDR